MSDRVGRIWTQRTSIGQGICISPVGPDSSMSGGGENEVVPTVDCLTL